MAIVIGVRPGARSGSNINQMCSLWFIFFATDNVFDGRIYMSLKTKKTEGLIQS